MFIVGEAVIDDDVGAATFCCDLTVCKGACCCIEGARGAPLEDDEVLEIRKAYPSAKQYLSEKSIRAIEAHGLVEGSRGNYATTCVGERECVFVFFENGIARCSFEKAFEDGFTDWRKPISCHLFPIRIRSFGQEFVRYEQIDECEGGRKRGNREKVALTAFLREALTRKYGVRWYTAFLERCNGKAKT